MMKFFSNTLKTILYELAKPELKKIEKFKNIHESESCYIFGDGISIKSMDVGQFADRKSIVVNNFLFHKNLNLIDCRYSIVSAPYFFSPIFGYEKEKRMHFNNIAKLFRGRMSIFPQISYFFDLSNYPFIRGNNIFYTYRRMPSEKYNISFIGNKINCYSGVMRAAVMMAIYMGFKEIHLIGFDYTHVPSKSLHWYEKGSGILYPQIAYEKEFFLIANEFVKIKTITLEGGSDVLDSITYKEFTGREPIFFENYELIEKKYLDALSTWNGYQIY